MTKPLRHVTVAVGVVFDPNLGFLLFFNANWKGCTFAMKKCPPDVDPAEMALTALEEDSPLRFPEAIAEPAAVVGAFGISKRTGEEMYCDYHVYELAPGPAREGPAADQRARFFRYEELLASSQVTWSANEIARALVEFQEVCVGVISRQTAAGREFLLVYHPTYGYFFPAARRKTDSPPEYMAKQAVRWDTAYTGELSATWCEEIPDLHISGRYGDRQRAYRFHVCRVDVCGADLSATGNPLESAIDGFAKALTQANKHFGPHGYGGWFTEAQLTHGAGLSPTLAPILRAALRCAEAG